MFLHSITGLIFLTKYSILFEAGTKQLNNVRQHNCFITQGSYIGYMFWLTDQSFSGLFCRLSHKVLWLVT